MEINNNSKRGQIATTMSWFVAMLVIVFILVIFLAMISLLTADKKISILFI